MLELRAHTTPHLVSLALRFRHPALGLNLNRSIKLIEVLGPYFSVSIFSSLDRISLCSQALYIRQAWNPQRSTCLWRIGIKGKRFVPPRLAYFLFETEFRYIAQASLEYEALFLP